MSNPPTHLEQLIRDIAADIGATEAAAFAVRRDFRDGFWTDLLVHIRADDAGPEVRAAAVAAFKDVIAPCVAQGKAGAIEVAAEDDGRGKQYCIVTPGLGGSEVTGVAAFIVRCGDPDAARAVLTRALRGGSGA